MPVTLGAPAEHGFDEPLGLMSDCHRRIEHFLGILVKVSEDRLGAALTDEQRRAIEASLKYFDTAAPWHTEDEERSLFPRLRGLNPAGARDAIRSLAELEADHAAAGLLHGQVRNWFRKWLDLGTLAGPEQRELEHALRALQEIYRRHIDVEDRVIFPLAGEVLSRDQLAQLGAEMAERRGLSPATAWSADPLAPS